MLNLKYAQLRRTERGFTLIEIMVVLLLIAVLIASAIGFKSTQKAIVDPKQFAKQLQDQIIFAQEFALLYPATLGIQFSDNYYQFLRLGEQGWEKAPQSALASYHIPTTTEFTLHSKHESSADNDPQLVINNNGELTAFHLQITMSGKQATLSYDHRMQWRAQ